MMQYSRSAKLNFAKPYNLFKCSIDIFSLGNSERLIVVNGNKCQPNIFRNNLSSMFSDHADQRWMVTKYYLLNVIVDYWR